MHEYESAHGACERRKKLCNNRSQLPLHPIPHRRPFRQLQWNNHRQLTYPSYCSENAELNLVMRHTTPVLPHPLNITVTRQTMLPRQHTLYGQTPPPFIPTTTEDGPPVLRAHALTKTMAPGASSLFWLIGSFRHRFMKTREHENKKTNCFHVFMFS